MAMARYEGVVTDKAGNVVPFATIEVRRDQPGRPVVPLFGDRNGTVGLGNPVQADAQGAFGFHLPGGVYRIRAYTGPSAQPTFEVIKRYQAVGTAAERDIEDLILGLNSGLRPFATEAELQAYVPDEGMAIIGRVLNDPDPTKNGDYIWSEDEWVRQRGLPDTLATLSITGGDANNIEATVAPGVDPANVVMLTITPVETNTAPVQINGKPLVSLTGTALLPGQLVAARPYLVDETEDQFRLRQDVELTGIPAGIEAAATAAMAQIVPARDETLTARTDAQTAESNAAAFAADAELAADGALAGGTIYADIATGRAAVADNAYFKVLGSGDVSFRLYKRLSSSTQELAREQPSTQAVTRASLNAYRDGLWMFLGDGDPDQIPVDTSTSGKVLLAKYRTSGKLVLDSDAALLSAYRSALWNLWGDGDPSAVPVEVTDTGKVLVARSAADGRLISGDSGTTPPDAMVYVSVGTLRINGAGGGDRVLNADAGKTWLAAVPFANSAMAIYQDGAGQRFAVRIAYQTGTIFPDARVFGWSDDGQSNAEGQAGTGVARLHAAYPAPDRLRMANLGVRLGLVTTGGTSVALNGAGMTGLLPLADAIEGPQSSHGTTTVAAAAGAYVKRAIGECGGWTPNMVVWGNAEGGQTIANLLNDAPGGYYAFTNTVTAVTRFVALLGASQRFVYRVMLMAQGESDPSEVSLGAKHDMLRSQVEAAIKPITGQSESVLMFSAQMSSFLSLNAHVRSILSYAVANAAAGKFFCLGPTYPFPFAEDFLHHTSIGHQMRGELAAAAYAEVENKGYFRPLRMLSASITGASQITVQLSEAAVNDEAAGIAPIPNKGIAVPGKTITDVTATGSTIVITVSGAAAGATSVQSALAGHSGSRTQETIPRSTIRSVASLGTHSHNGAAIRKWLCHDEVNIT